MSREQACAADFNTLQFSLVNMYLLQMRKNNVWAYLQQWVVIRLLGM